MNKLELLEKIEPIFFDKTFKDVSLQDIADVFGIKKASLYYYFESKEDLFINLLDYSFNRYLNFLNEIFDLKLKDFIKEFIFYPSVSKNFFSVIIQNNYCYNIELRKIIQNNQQIILDLFSVKMSQKYDFSKEKSFILISLLEDIGRKKCLFWKCPIDIESIIENIEKLFK